MYVDIVILNVFNLNFKKFFLSFFLRQQRNDGGGCAIMRERSERVESPGTYICN